MSGWWSTGRPFLVVAALGVIALLSSWLSPRRPDAPDVRSAERFVVTVGSDGGPSSLREAIVGAMRSTERVRIELAVPEILLEAPLPPLVNGKGIVIASAPGAPPTVIRADHLSAPVLDLAAPFSTLERLVIRGGDSIGLRVRAHTVAARDLEVHDCDVGIQIVGAAGFELERGRFFGNRIGVEFVGNVDGARVLDSEFSGHRAAAIWAVSSVETIGDLLRIANNRFADDETAIVLGNVAAEVTGNEIVGAANAGLYLIGRGAVVEGNRIRDGAGGLVATGAIGSRVRDNEIADHRAIGAMLSSSSNVAFEDNRLYRNGYGVVVVFGDAAAPNVLRNNQIVNQQQDGVVVIGGSPVLDHNELLANRSAGLRLLEHFSSAGARTAADPLLRNNRIETNGEHQVVRGIYREKGDGR